MIDFIIMCQQQQQIIKQQNRHWMQQKKEKRRQEQLNKRLQKIQSIKQLKKIVKCSKEQNKKLVSQVKQLRDRIQVIMNNRKIKMEESSIRYGKNQADQKINNELWQLKKQLKNRYTVMKKLKQELDTKNLSKIQQTELNKMQNFNILRNTQKNIKQLTKQLQDLKATNKKLQKTFQTNQKQENVNQPRIQQLQLENKNLRIKIADVRKNDHRHDYQSIKVQTTLIHHQKKDRQINARKSMFDLKSMSVIDKKDIISAQEVNLLKKQVLTLKKEIELKQGALTNQQIEQKRKKQELMIKNKESLKKLKQNQLQKLKLEQQNNSWKKKWNDICKAIQYHNNKIKKISVSVQAQQYIDPKPLRRDYAGILNKIRFDDRIMLKDNKTAMIVGLMIYQIQKGIVTIQAFYNNGQRTYVPIPLHFLERCRVTKIQCSQGDFFKLFKIKYNSLDNKITKLEVRSNKNIKYQYGEKKQWSDLTDGDTVYGFDIGIKQYPTSIFGSYNYYKNNWLLEGFGVEINELTD